ncbi:PD-(D/E)XK nuclease family protein [Ramlibacter sp. PS4R-6]|uniref:PD-(D/E)XK nuclease family protein n=1 Tax=Ramlibacter sp. PS4R-6 TaxID=3133438 RepID=UPI0030B1FB04
MDAIAETHHAGSPLAGLMSRVGELIERHGAHPARTVVLLPFVHLLQPAREAWARVSPLGFMPRFETTATWSAGAAFEPGVDDFCGELARDLLAARSLLERAGLGAQADLLAPRLAEAAGQLAPVAAAIEPAARGAWAARARHSLAAAFDAPVLAHEAAVASIAVEWVAASSFATDSLLVPSAGTELIVVAQGLRDEPLPLALARAHGDKAHVVRLQADGAMGAITLHEAGDPADEAERAAACVLQHVREGRVPVALAAVDRQLTRRIRALLEQGHATLRDETGWKLSTTRAGAHAMLALRTALHAASSDAVIDWLKNSPVHAPASVLALERRVRRNGTREWRHVLASDLGDGQQVVFDFVQAAREAMQEARPLPQWLAQWRSVLQGSGQWRALEGDAAGQQVIAALRLAESDRAELDAFPPARRRMGLAEFVAWANDILEAENFRPPGAADAQVVILPFHQLLGRPFAALVVPGCDEARLPASPDPAGVWTPAQREALGLPTRQALERETREAWRQALQAPHGDILWRCADESGEAVLPATLVQELVLARAAAQGSDPRTQREVAVQPTSRPVPAAHALPLASLSASAYEDLRKCPYRFFALRQLALREPDEIDVDVDKRDFGNWLHRVLNAFHERLARDASAPRRELLDEAAEQVMREMRLDEGEFLPFRAAWAQAREGYLAWLAKHEAKEGATFQAAESQHTLEHAGVQLLGRVDRIDTLRAGGRMVMDYKTESLATSQARVKQPGEDTQLAFYAALLGDEDLRAAYVNIGERGETKTVEQGEVAAARDMLLAGIAADFRRIGQGAPLPALGEGKACDWCGARGLCRKDFWP